MASIKNLIQNSRRLAFAALLGSSLALAGCGGGGGDGEHEDGGEDPIIEDPIVTPPVQTEYTVASTPELDGTARINGVSNEGRSDVEPWVGDGPFVVGSGSNVFASFYSFDLSSLPAGVRIRSATMSLYNRAILGNPQGMNVLVRVDHVRFGLLFPQSPLGGVTEAFDFAQITALNQLGRKDLDVTAQVQADLDAGRTRSQYRLRGAIGTNNDNVGDVMRLTDGEDSAGTGELPLLIIEIE